MDEFEREYADAAREAARAFAVWMDTGDRDAGDRVLSRLALDPRGVADALMADA